MPQISLGKLEREDVRKAWPNEAVYFTPWLAQAASLTDLGKIIGIELELVATEQNVGPFRADILCKDTLTGRYVLIENQLDWTDHSHLGQLLTYAAGLKAMALVWIARKFTSEHRAALDWLNEITHGEIYCFGLEIELWRIGESAMAPKLNVVCQPNDWSNRVQPPPPAVLTEVGQLYQAYWTEFKSFMDKNSTLVRARQPTTQNWAEFAIGRTDFSLQIWLGFEKKYLDVSLVIKNTTTKTHFHLLQKQKDEIESILGVLDWYEMATGKWSYISQKSETIDLQNRDQWPEQFAWLKERLEAFHRVFAPRVKALRLDSGEQ